MSTASLFCAQRWFLACISAVQEFSSQASGRRITPETENGSVISRNHEGALVEQIPLDPSSWDAMQIVASTGGKKKGRTGVGDPPVRTTREARAGLRNCRKFTRAYPVPRETAKASDDSQRDLRVTLQVPMVAVGVLSFLHYW